jgi:cardiolipin synthase (CMP-forming)
MRQAIPRRCTHSEARLSFTTMTPRRTLGTIPNLLSCSRLALAAGFVASSATETQVGIIGAAAVTDFLDGWIARRVHATSRWGAMLDPIADRFFVLTVVATMLFTGRLGTGAYFVMIMRDLATAVGFLVSRIIPWLRTVTFQARISGKVVTVLQLLTLAALLVAPVLAPVLLVMVGVASVLSIADYTLALWRARAR